VAVADHQLEPAAAGNPLLITTNQRNGQHLLRMKWVKWSTKQYWWIKWYITWWWWWWWI
jgi:hypothetical protein